MTRAKLIRDVERLKIKVERLLAARKPAEGHRAPPRPNDR
jgi:hypothetical protein